MKKQVFHKKLLAVLLLIVFSVGVTPRKYFHEFFSNHTDYIAHPTKEKTGSIESYKYNCGFVELVSVQLFLSTDQTAQEGQRFLSKLFAFEYCNPNNQKPFSCFSHRGPPAA